MNAFLDERTWTEDESDEGEQIVTAKQMKLVEYMAENGADPKMSTEEYLAFVDEKVHKEAVEDLTLFLNEHADINDLEGMHESAEDAFERFLKENFDCQPWEEPCDPEFPH